MIGPCNGALCLHNRSRRCALLKLFFRAQERKFEPGNIDFKLGLVKAYVGLNNLDAAIVMLDELLQEFPERDNLWALQANIFIQKEQPNRALPGSRPRSRRCGG